MRFTKKTFLIVTLLLALSTTGCSKFNRDWRAAGKVQPHGVAGRWEGKWASDANGHSGKLRCLLTRVSENSYEARFHAKYARIFSFGYTATLTGSHSNGVFAFSGDADLGKMAGGIYTYRGTVNATNFFSTYTSKYDHGTFEMQRPE